MNTVLTIYDCPEEWYQETYICNECEQEFMLAKHYDGPKFCPCCGVKFDALRIKYRDDCGGRMETRFLNKEDN